MIRDQFRRCATEQVTPFAHDCHPRDALIPMAVITELDGLGGSGPTNP